MELRDITAENWKEVVFLTTNENDMPTLCEEFVASNALSLVQAQFEKGWLTKAIEEKGQLIGFAMYGYCEKQKIFELCRIMIDKRYQGKGYGTQAIKLVLEEMKLLPGCEEVYLSTDPENRIGKYLYEKIGFVNTGKQVEEEELFCFQFDS